jgi:hypothetical protein
MPPLFKVGTQCGNSARWGLYGGRRVIGVPTVTGIRGKIRYFGIDKKKALEKYLAQATYLHRAQGLVQKILNDTMTLKQLCDL